MEKVEEREMKKVFKEGGKTGKTISVVIVLAMVFYPAWVIYDLTKKGLEEEKLLQEEIPGCPFIVSGCYKWSFEDSPWVLPRDGWWVKDTRNEQIPK